MLRMRFSPRPQKRGLRPRREAIGRQGAAAILAILLLPALAWSDIGICGYPPSGRVTFIRAGQTVAAFTVTAAASVAQRRRGLMHCPALEPGTGMLFIYEAARPRVFWMKDTPLALGIVFIAADGAVLAVERGAPGSLERIRSPGPVRFVLEINASEAQSLRVGDRMQRIAPDPPQPAPNEKYRP